MTYASSFDSPLSRSPWAAYTDHVEKSSVAKEERHVIRSRLIESALKEQDNRLAVQNALVVAKLARYDYPKYWPELLSTLAQALRTHNTPLPLARALLVLLHVVKELSTGQLIKSKRNLEAATPELVQACGNLYFTTVSTWRTSPSDTSAPLMQQSLLALKVLRRLLVSGYEKPHQDAAVVSVWNLTQDHLGTFVSLQGTGHAHQALLEDHMLQLAKLHHGMAKANPVAFALLPNTVELVRSYWILTKAVAEAFKDDPPTAEKLALKALLIIRVCVKLAHNPSHAIRVIRLRSPDEKEEEFRATELIKQSVLTPALVHEVMEVVVTKFFVFRESDLREWEEEPEEWEKREEGYGLDWEFSVRSCAEKLFLDLAINYKEMLVQPLLQVFASVADPNDDRVFFKDSVYTAVGLAGPVLRDHLDFAKFVQDVLVKDVRNSTPGFNIIRRRAAILLGQWISIKIPQETRPLVYQIFNHLLDPSDATNDQVVRVTAGRQFKNVCDDWDFVAAHFTPFAESILTRLMQLVAEVESTDTKMALLSTISVVVERLEHDIAPFAERIISMLSPLWDASAEEHLMKQVILTLMTRLVNAMKAQSLPMHGMLFPIIRGAVEPGSETWTYLAEDALDLWETIVVQTPAPASAELLALVPALYPIYDFASESTPKALEITEAYVLLAPEHMLAADTRARLFSALAPLVGSPQSVANALVCNLIELIVHQADRLGGHVAVAQTCDTLLSTGIFATLLHGLHGCWMAHGTTGPRRWAAHVDDIPQAAYLAIFARLILGSVDAFYHACAHVAATTAAPQGPSDLPSTMSWLLEECFRYFDNLGNPKHRKLLCLALTSLLATPSPFILLQLQSLLTMWTDLITELRDDSADPASDSLVYPAPPPGPPSEAPDDARRRALTHADVVHTAALPRVVALRLRGCVEACGGLEAFQRDWLVNVDREVWEGFGRLGVW